MMEIEGGITIRVRIFRKCKITVIFPQVVCNIEALLPVAVREILPPGEVGCCFMVESIHPDIVGGERRLDDETRLTNKLVGNGYQRYSPRGKRGPCFTQ